MNQQTEDEKQQAHQKRTQEHSTTPICFPCSMRGAVEIGCVDWKASLIPVQAVEAGVSASDRWMSGLGEGGRSRQREGAQLRLDYALNKPFFRSSWGSLPLPSLSPHERMFKGPEDREVACHGIPWACSLLNRSGGVEHQSLFSYGEGERWGAPVDGRNLLRWRKPKTSGDTPPFDWCIILSGLVISDDSC